METLTRIEEHEPMSCPVQLLPIPPNDEPVVLSPEQSDYYRKRNLLQKIKICVSFDLSSQVNGRLAQYHEMTKMDQLKFKKQCSRLFEACLTSAEDEEYITNRFNEIVSEVMLSSGSTHELLAVNRNPYV